MEVPLRNDDLISRFEHWLLASYRTDGTVTLRIRHARMLAEHVQIALATDEQIEQALISTRHYSAEYRHSILASWKLLYRWAAAKRLVMFDPTLLLDPIPVRKRVPRIAPDAAVTTALLNATARDRALVMLARYACLRLTEIATLHMKHRTGETLIIRGKGDKERFVDINPPLMLALAALEAEQPYGAYFPGGTAGHLHPQSVHKIIKRLTGWHPHALRHAGATAAYRTTRNLRAVQEMLGHSSLATTERYLHITSAERREAALATIIHPPARIAA
ncbi:integrase [Microbacterium sp. 3H14]|uniref:tyrosine-type recombinase/integrase n=1 Tax=Microbacterium sp. 3H14 TaxID=2555725 RepID=UPI00106C4D58|nr:tyrosine-type recombinase/integrase [Microbacterium sp. 3H14]TFB15118.1 integrase [Microbacterium sp. 3H14]TFB15139.1 integrase [Microbacterium sp. 3H14]